MLCKESDDWLYFVCHLQYLLCDEIFKARGSNGSENVVIRLTERLFPMGLTAMFQELCSDYQVNKTLKQ